MSITNITQGLKIDKIIKPIDTPSIESTVIRDVHILQKINEPNLVKLNLNKKEIIEKHNVREFVQASPSLQTPSTIQLESINLEEYIDGPEGYESRKKLADKLEHSITTYGFFNVVNFGYTTDQLERLKSIAQSILEIPHEEKLKYLAGSTDSDTEDRTVSLGGERGAGFKPKGYWSMPNGVRDSIEHYNFRDMLHDKYFFSDDRKYPEIVRVYLPEIAAYFRHLHFVVLKKLLSLCDLILEIPEGTLWNNHFQVYEEDLYNSGAGFGRFMHYLGMKSDEERKTDKTWLRGHSDGDSFTFITSQPILSLQIRDYYTGEWKYVGHRDNSIIVNVGDALEFLTGSYFKSSIHRVIAPPLDQIQFKRLVLIYFCNCSLATVIDPETLDSPKLTEVGLGKKPLEWEKITFAEWDEEKGRLFGKKNLNDVQGDEPKLVKMYGRLHERWHQAE